MKRYEDIKRDILKNITSVSTTEGSYADIIVSPVSLELEKAYVEMNNIASKLDVENLFGEELEKYVKQETGIVRKKGTKATGTVRIQALERTIVEKGTLVSNMAGLYYLTQNKLAFEKDTIKEVTIFAENEGSKYNTKANTINNLPVEIAGVVSVKNIEDVRGGADIETDDQLRNRYKRRIVEGEQDGNIAQYKDWADNYNEIGTSKVFPLWNGGNTVKIAITNRQFQVADSTLVSSFQEYLDPGSKGLGNGKAPIGSKVTVTGGIKKEINITGNVELVEGYNNPEGVSEMISKYFASITYRKNSVNYIRLGSSILDTPSIAGLSELRVNGGIEDIPLVGEEIPTLNSLNLTVVSP